MSDEIRFSDDGRPICLHCAVPVGDGGCDWCRQVRGREVASARAALDFAPHDAELMRVKLGEDWRGSPKLRDLAVLADQTLAGNPLNAIAVDRLLTECADHDRDRIARFRYALVLSALAHGGVADELARLDMLVTDDRVDLGELAQYLADLVMGERSQTTALLLPGTDDLPHWLVRPEGA